MPTEISEQRDTRIKTLFYCDSAELQPFKKHYEDAGFDLRAKHNYKLLPNDTEVIETGVHAIIPEGYVGIVKPRSGLGVKGTNVTAGVIDSSYRGEIKVVLQHFGKELLLITAGDRIAQLIILPCLLPYEMLIEEIPTDTQRGISGFGSSGVK